MTDLTSRGGCEAGTGDPSSARPAMSGPARQRGAPPESGGQPLAVRRDGAKKPDEPGRRRTLLVCVVGDDLVTGAGDPRCLGWIGRVGARTPRDEAMVSLFPLGVPGENTADLLNRWREECTRRFMGADPADCRLVIGLGREDVHQMVSLPRSRLHLANMLDECTERGLPVLVVGPPPGPDEQLNERIAELSGAFADVCHRRRVPYVDTFTPLLNHEDWLADLSAGDGRHPGQAGYGLIAWLVLHSGWTDFIGLTAP